MAVRALVLDQQSIDPAKLSIPALMRELNLQRRPAALLVRLMNHLERRRQARGLGWSRAWNKDGLTVFRTHVHDPIVDAEYFAALAPIWERFLAGTSGERAFVNELLADPGRMGFTFYHNRTAPDGRQFEGLTISLGRKVTDAPGHRDRLDVVLEDAREGGEVDGLVDSMRLYVCPWSRYQNQGGHHRVDCTEPSGEELKCLQPIYHQAVAAYHAWKDVPERQWTHWAVRYIEYFGPRDFIPRHSSFT